MSASPYSNGPSRKSRLRQQRSGTQPGFSLPDAPARENDAPGADAGEQIAPEVPAETSDPEDKPSTVARPRQPAGRTNFGFASPPKHRLRQALLALALLGCGTAAGYLLGASTQSSTLAKRFTRTSDTIETGGKSTLLTEDERAQLDLAFSEGKTRQYKDSQRLFASMVQKHPEWTKIPLENARMAIYQQDYMGAQKILAPLTQGTSAARPDAFFLLGVLDLKTRNYQAAEAAFEAATSADPTRSEFFYFWGDCLRQEGKPQEAGVRFRSALIRNQYETAEDLQQLKVWLCDIMTDQEKASGDDAVIDASLASPYPRSAALMAAAARSIKASRFAEAAAFMTRGRAAMDQTVFTVVIHDPTFVQESWRPELAPFYAPEPTASRPPAAAPGPSASVAPASPAPTSSAQPAAPSAPAPP